MDIVHLLPDSIANQIAAGEVVQRPASVVKELMENAIDAGAKNIQVILKNVGKAVIQVIDDGKGMSPMDARMAFERHAHIQNLLGPGLIQYTNARIPGRGFAFHCFCSGSRIKNPASKR